MKILNKDKVTKDVISDQGIQKKTDSFSIAVIIISNTLSVVLVVLGLLTVIYS